MPRILASVILSHPCKWAVMSILQVYKLRLGAGPGTRVIRLSPNAFLPISLPFVGTWVLEKPLPACPESSPAGPGGSRSCAGVCDPAEKCKPGETQFFIKTRVRFSEICSRKATGLKGRRRLWNSPRLLAVRCPERNRGNLDPHRGSRSSPPRASLHWDPDPASSCRKRVLVQVGSGG